MIRVCVVLALALAAAGCVPCEQVGVNLGEACLPEKMAPHQVLEIEVREACGTSCSLPPACTARVELSTVLVVTGQDECTADCVPTGTCEVRATKCLLPELVPGQYTVVLPGLPSRTLTVEAGAPTTCTL